MKNLRQIRYNIETDTAEQETLRHRWTFFILNEQTEIKRIKERCISKLSQNSEFNKADDYQELAENSIPKTGGLHYLAFAVSSTKGDLTSSDKGKIYTRPQKFTLDRRLTPEKNDIWFDTIYLPSLLEEYTRKN